MAHLIDKDALVAEIKRRKELVSDPILSGDDLMIGERNAFFNLLSFLDTLEVKEVDLNREMQAFALLYLEPLKISDSNIGISITMAQLYSCAKHFFELGLKAQKKEKSNH